MIHPEEENKGQGQSISQLLGLDEQAQAQMAGDTQKFIIKGTKLIHSEKSRDQILKGLSTGNPLESVANATVAVVQRLDAAARQSGVETHDLVKIEGSLDLLHQIAEVGAASGKTPKMSEEDIQASYAIAVEKYIKSEIQAGRIDPKALQSEMSKGIEKMPPEQREALDSQLKNINRTATGMATPEAPQGMLASQGE